MQTKRIIKGVLFGMAIGTAAGVGAMCVMKQPKPCKFKRTLHRACMSLSSMLENLADFAR